MLKGKVFPIYCLLLALSQPTLGYGLDVAQEGFRAHEQGKLDEAIQLYSKALLGRNQSRVELATIYGNRCIAQLEKGAATNDVKLFERAIADCDQSVLIKPLFPLGYIKRGDAYQAKGELERSLEDFTVAMQIDPNQTIALLSRARVLTKMGKNDLALKDYTAFIEKEPKMAAALRERGALLATQGTHAKAVEDFNTVLKLNPEDNEILLMRAKSQSALNKYKESIQDFDQLIARLPKEASLFIDRGSLHASLGNMDLAFQDFNTAATLDPKNPLVPANLGLLYFLHGAYTKARTAFDQVIVLQPEDPFAPLWSYLAQRRQNPNKQIPFPYAAKNPGFNHWPGPLYELFMETKNAEQVIQAAQSKNNSEDSVASLHEALFFIAQKELYQGQTSAAIQNLQRVFDQKKGSMVIRSLAQEELKRLQKTAETVPIQTASLSTPTDQDQEPKPENPAAPVETAPVLTAANQDKIPNTVQPEAQAIHSAENLMDWNPVHPTEPREVLLNIMGGGLQANSIQKHERQAPLAEMTKEPPPVETPPPITSTEKPAPPKEQQASKIRPSQESCPSIETVQFPDASYLIDIGSINDTQKATNQCLKVHALGLPVYSHQVRIQDQAFFRLRAGPFIEEAAAQDAFARIKNETDIVPTRIFMTQGSKGAKPTIQTAQTKKMIPTPTTCPTVGGFKPKKGIYLVEIGSFGQAETAIGECVQVLAIGIPAYYHKINLQGVDYFRLRAGPFQNQQEAQYAANRIAKETKVKPARLIELP
ncbi:MAG: tetratricopeptide repeat protein [Magnetococcus sp. DMHC-6]